MAGKIHNSYQDTIFVQGKDSIYSNNVVSLKVILVSIAIRKIRPLSTTPRLQYSLAGTGGGGGGDGVVRTPHATSFIKYLELLGYVVSMFCSLRF